MSEEVCRTATQSFYDPGDIGCQIVKRGVM